MIRIVGVIREKSSFRGIVMLSACVQNVTYGAIYLELHVSKMSAAAAFVACCSDNVLINWSVHFKLLLHVFHTFAACGI